MSASSKTEDLVCNFSRFYILTILYEAPQHGYSILSTFKDRTGKEISPSLVYPFLRQLEKKYLVTRSLKPVGEKKKKVFELTPKGAELCEKLFKRFSALVSVAIESSLTTCASCGCKIFEGAHKETVNGKENAFCCIHCARSYKKDQIRNGESFRSQLNCKDDNLIFTL
jgi:DNA-binding PadR family transcriptional regulator